MREIMRMRMYKNRDVRLTNIKKETKKGEGRDMDKSRVNSGNNDMWLLVTRIDIW